jgi:hypothetical protein
MSRARPVLRIACRPAWRRPWFMAALAFLAAAACTVACIGLATQQAGLAARLQDRREALDRAQHRIARCAAMRRRDGPPGGAERPVDLSDAALIARAHAAAAAGKLTLAGFEAGDSDETGLWPERAVTLRLSGSYCGWVLALDALRTFPQPWFIEHAVLQPAASGLNIAARMRAVGAPATAGMTRAHAAGPSAAGATSVSVTGAGGDPFAPQATDLSGPAQAARLLRGVLRQPGGHAALVESGPRQQWVQRGDAIGGEKVVAIDARRIVLRGMAGSRTLRLPERGSP